LSKDQERGKALERTVAKLLGCRRRRNGEGLGFDDGVNLDGSDMKVSIECKASEVLQLRGRWIEQARRNALGRPWLLVQRPFRSQTIYVTCDFEFLVQLLSEADYCVETAEAEEPVQV
jgi:hypothetical protein